jgi:hypothetical protein
VSIAEIALLLSVHLDGLCKIHNGGVALLELDLRVEEISLEERPQIPELEKFDRKAFTASLRLGKGLLMDFTLDRNVSKLLAEAGDRFLGS